MIVCDECGSNDIKTLSFIIADNFDFTADVILKCQCTNCQSVFDIENKIMNIESNRKIKDIPRKPNGVVRCKDCSKARLRTGYTDRYVCLRWNNTTGKNEFCSYGSKLVR